MIVNQAAIDWMTITSYEKEFGRAVKSFVDNEVEVITKQQSKLLGYSGTRVVAYRGSIFLGQSLAGHWMLTASGEIADAIFRHHCLIHMHVKCTRMDIQVTVPEPEMWSQRALAGAVADSGRFGTYSHIVSQDGQTVYLGSRKSDVFVRIYEKNDAEIDAGRVWLRYEVEYKADRSNSLYERLRDGANMGGFLVDSIQRVSAVEPALGDVFLPCLAGIPPNRIRLVKELGNTEKWLMNQVFPALQKAVNGPNGEWVREWLNIILGGGGSEPVT